MEFFYNLKMVISLIAAMDRNRLIGKDNSLPWNLPEDMRRFRDLTTGKPVIMGRKTFESIGRALPNRKNIVITRDKDYKAEGCIVVDSVKEALKAAEGADEVMIIGGAQVYKEFLPIANKMHLTLIDKEFEGDAYFPEYNKPEWKVVKKEQHKDNDFEYVFVDLERN